MNAGIVASDEAKNAHTAVKGKKLDWVTYVVGKKTVDVEAQYPQEERKGKGEELPIGQYQADVFKPFIAALTSKGARYGLLDFHYEEDGNPRDKVVIFKWVPDVGTKVSEKMLYGSTFQGFCQALDVACKVEASSHDELDFAAIVAKLTRA